MTHYRGWREPATWRQGPHALLVGPNNAGKTSLLSAVDPVLNPFRDAYRDRLTVWDYPDRDTSQPVEVTVILDDLSDNDLDHFEAYLEGRREDGTFGDWDSPEEEFDQSDLVLRLGFRGEYGEPARSFFVRPEADGASVRQADGVLRLESRRAAARTLIGSAGRARRSVLDELRDERRQQAAAEDKDAERSSR